MRSEGHERWEAHSRQWRDAREVIATWPDAGKFDRRLLRGRAEDGWWDLLRRLDVTLLVTREYEHLVMALTPSGDGGSVSYLRLPHPSGIAVDRDRRLVHVASTRNPNQVFDLTPVTGLLARTDTAEDRVESGVLVPHASRFYPGCTYLHDLAFVGGHLHANAVGHNAIIRLDNAGYKRVWWPKAIETRGSADFSRNYLQLNSIAAGPQLETSFFSASTATISSRRPGHRNFPVDRRGVIFSGASREPVAFGLTRPHSARLYDGLLWVANSGYGELGTVADGSLHVHCVLNGWTRGLTLRDGVAFVGTSRVLPRFSAYAPGLRVERARCGVHAIDIASGELLGSYTWPLGNQIFAVECVEREWASGFPFRAGTPAPARWSSIFYKYDSERVRLD